MTYEVAVGEKSYKVELSRKNGSWHCRLDGEEVDIDVELLHANVLSLISEGSSYEIKREATSQGLQILIGNHSLRVTVVDRRTLHGRPGRASESEGPKKIRAPMPGKVVRVIAPVGAAVSAGQGVIVIEAMKMQNELKSPKKGRIQQIVAAEGATVDAGDVLAIVE